MGCVSSKLFKKDFENTFQNSDFPNHVVSLTSSTYGALKLENPSQDHSFDQTPSQIIKECVKEAKKSPPHEVINAWELMEDLDDQECVVPSAKISPKSRVFLRGFGDIDARSPLKFLNQMASPRKFKKFGGKENKGVVGFSPAKFQEGSPLKKMSPRSIFSRGGTPNDSRCDRFSPKTSVKLQESPLKVSPRLKISKGGTPNDSKCESLRVNSVVVSSRRKCLSPLFDPKLVVKQEEEEIKKMVFATPMSRKARNSQDSESMLELFEKKCPPGGENSVVIYTTTLRGIRKTFEDCNTARAILESNDIRVIERDISMDSGFKEELRGLMDGKKEVVKVPLVFVKGRLIGGADEMVKLEEEGNLGILLDGIPRAEATACHGCAGVRFTMCVNCNGSRKVLAKDGKNSVKCGECNENGLVQCPFCC